MRKITVVTDSSAYFKRAEAEGLGVKIVPIGWSAGGRFYLESYGDCNGEFESVIKKSPDVSTAHPGAASYLSVFEEETAKGNEVLCLTISSRLSGAYGSAHEAAARMANGSVAVFDSRLSAGGLYLLVKKAAELAAVGLSLEQITEKLYEIRDSITVMFSVGDIEPLRRSGRIGLVRKGVATILNRRPILVLGDGVVISDMVARGENDVIRKLVAGVSPNAAEIVVSYVGNGRLAADIYGALVKSFAPGTVRLQKMGPVLGIHLGLNVVAVSYI